jgi:hypothetical protein
MKLVTTRKHHISEVILLFEDLLSWFKLVFSQQNESIHHLRTGAKDLRVAVMMTALNWLQANNYYFQRRKEMMCHDLSE